jgi:hypothetical protein
MGVVKTWLMNPNLQLQNKLSDPYWRINNLYKIVDKSGCKTTFKLNWAQEYLFYNSWYCNVILKARQLGISTYTCLLFLDRCLFNSNVSAGIIAHTREDAEFLFKRIKFAYDNLPSELKEARVSKIDSARELVFNNGSSIRVGTSMRGSTLQYLHISEFGKICAKFPDKAQEIITGSLNTLAPGQIVFIESTAEGREGYFYDICKKAEADQIQKKELTNMSFKFHFFPWWKEPSYRIGSCVTMSEEMIEYFYTLETQGIYLDNEQKYWYAAKVESQGDNMKREFPSTPEESWEQSIDGAYYSKKITLARHEKRICFIPYDDKLLVHTAWDLGYNDSTSIWFFQIQNKEIRLIDYLEGSGESLQHWLNVIKSKEYTYGKFLAPHDIMVHEYTTGMTRQQTARQLGFSLIPVQKVEVISGIDAVRNILNRCWFDENKCAQGIKALENYKKQWDDRNGCWMSKPLHNWSSHGADAFRTLATGLYIVTGGKTEAELNKERMDSLKDQSGLYPGSYLYTGDMNRNDRTPYGKSGMFK